MANFDLGSCTELKKEVHVKKSLNEKSLDGSLGGLALKKAEESNKCTFPFALKHNSGPAAADPAAVEAYCS